MAPEVCPNCGADVPTNAKACPECGACEETGWSNEATAGDVGLPDEEFNYSDFVKKEFGDKTVRPRGIPWFWWVVGLVLAAILIILLFR